MASRPPPPGLRRLVFGLLFVFALVIPICLFILMASRRLTDPAGIITLVRWWSAAAGLLLVWSAIYINEEPGMVRIALYLSAALFAFLTLFAHTGSNSGPVTASASAETTPPAKSEESKGGKTSKTGGAAPKAEKVQEAILGKWQLDGSNEIIAFMKDDTFVIRSEQGQAIWGRTKLIDSQHLQLIPAMAQGDKPVIFNDLVVGGETMSRVMDSGRKVSYHRIKTAADSAGVTGVWDGDDGRTLLLVPDGTFVLGEDSGNWELNGSQIVAKSDRPKGGTWHLAKSPEGHTLAGDWKLVTPGVNSITTTGLNFARWQKLDLAAAIVGKWQLSSGSAETLVYNKDGTCVLTTSAGKIIEGTYTVPDSTHLKAVPKGENPQTVPPWTVRFISDSKVIISVSDKVTAAYLRVK